MSALGGSIRVFDVLLDNVQLGALLVHHVGHVAEQLVELADRLLDIADFGFALDDHLFLEVDVVLVRQTQLLLLLLLLELGALLAGRTCVLEGSAGSRVGGLLLLDGLALELLELGEGGFELAAELGLGEALGGLSWLAPCPLARGMEPSYPDIRPCCQFLQTLSNLLELVRRLLRGGPHALPNPGGLAGGAELRSLV